ncbi:hypothetical protein N7508_000245 [Penicillium antarcticum]|uniref:uncharacterized protein n=1 Tax=Penicillium antarcticum TaxID=416450 RepID=UPI00239EB60E|nr:uncharacterized protein N7508_000245 [Penicillium antarcticum]KAJ5319962.1 hypothetical protein N7508_000245 [Penicillium antarcticum]
MLDLSHSNSSVDINKIVIIDADRLIVQNKDSSLSLGKEQDAVAAFDQHAPDEDGEKMVTKLSSAAPLRSRITKFEISAAHVIGIDESRKLVFLNQSFWVCSVDLSESGLETVKRKDGPSIAVSKHFFVPYDWFAGRRDVVCALAKSDIVLTRGGDLAVIRGGLDYAETVCLE